MKTKLNVVAAGIFLMASSASAATRYVWQSCPSPAPPYATWATAATNIQDAVDAALAGDEVVVTNGTYATGGRAAGTNVLVNRVAVDKPLTLRSVNGPEVTVIQGRQVPGTTNGDGAIRCVYLANGASLSGFTLTNGATRSAGYWQEQRGGGVWCESRNAVVSDCVVSGNSAAYNGGGAYLGYLNNCTLTANSASEGGGAFGATLNNCTLTGNSAHEGGGADNSTLRNCTLTANSAVYGGGASDGTLDHCTLTGNYGTFGGGASRSVLSDCTVAGNSATDGGGVSDATLSDCTVVGNSAQRYGGGAFNSVMTRCWLVGNLANLGGGAGWGSLDNCVVISNTATWSGGGASAVKGGGMTWTPAVLRNCTVVGNVAPTGAGTHLCILYNCILYFNQGSNWESYDDGNMHNCCTSPQPRWGAGNLTNAPLFVDYAGGNLRLQSNSPCINAGLNAYASSAADLDGNRRIVSGTVDIGAYEFQGPGSMISYAWLRQYGLPTDGSADGTDADADGHTTWQEWRCGTSPVSALSALRLLSASPAGTNVTVSWQSVAGVNYLLERSTNLWGGPPFILLAPNVPGQPATTIYTDTNAAALEPLFYRVGVGN